MARRLGHGTATIHTTVPLGELPGWEEMPWGGGEGEGWISNTWASAIV